MSDSSVISKVGEISELFRAVLRHTIDPEQQAQKLTHPIPTLTDKSNAIIAVCNACITCITFFFCHGHFP